MYKVWEQPSCINNGMQDVPRKTSWDGLTIEKLPILHFMFWSVYIIPKVFNQLFMCRPSAGSLPSANVPTARCWTRTSTRALQSTWRSWRKWSEKKSWWSILSRRGHCRVSWIRSAADAINKLKISVESNVGVAYQISSVTNKLMMSVAYQITSVTSSWYHIKTN